MRIHQVNISNFRGIKKATIFLNKNALLIGVNNVGKSTVLEALDLALGPERLSRVDAINEHDFYQSKYIDERDEPIKIKITVTFSELNKEEKNQFWMHLDCIKTETGEIISKSEVPQGQAGAESFPFVLRVEFEGAYESEEGEFRTATYFSTPLGEEGEREEVSRREKRIIGYIFLRSIRTGTRALSLERGSLLDILLKSRELKPGSWETVLAELQKLGNTISADEAIKPVIETLVSKVKEFVPISGEEKSTLFHVSSLTREHLRRTLTLFLSSDISRQPVPFWNLGNGTANILVFSLLTFIAEQKTNVIFAMEEPETALPPYTQRRIVMKLKDSCQQCLFTSHSPYIAEQFVPNETLVLKRGKDHQIESKPIILPDTLKKKIYMKDFRLRFAEGILSRAVLVVEGYSDQSVFYIISEKVAVVEEKMLPLDVHGVSVISSQGEGAMAQIGRFYKNLGIRVYAFHDKTDESKREEIRRSFDVSVENSLSGLEKLLSEKLPIGRLKQFWNSNEDFDDWPSAIKFPEDDSSERNWRDSTFEVLRARKGVGYASFLINLCEVKEIPSDITDLIHHINNDLSCVSLTPSGSDKY